MHLHMNFFRVFMFFFHKPVFEDYVDVTHTHTPSEKEKETHAKIWRYDDTMSLFFLLQQQQIVNENKTKPNKSKMKR